jgi:hypothetical protein
MAKEIKLFCEANIGAGQIIFPVPKCLLVLSADEPALRCTSYEDGKPFLRGPDSVLLCAMI